MSALGAARSWAGERVDDALRGVVGAIERERARKLAQPCVEKLVHERMAATATGVGWRLKRWWHRTRAKRWEARCWAAQHRNPELAACDMARRCGCKEK